MSNVKAREIIRYFIDVQKHAKFLWDISLPRADTQTDILPTCTLHREKGVISFHVQKIVPLTFSCQRTITLAGKPARLPRGGEYDFYSTEYDFCPV
jgi:hypothetical protein